MRVLHLCCFFLLASVSLAWIPSVEDFSNWMGEDMGPGGMGKYTFTEFRQKVLLRSFSWVESLVGADNLSPQKVNSEEYPYFKWVPQYVTSVLPGQTVNWAAPCFKTSTASASAVTDGIVTLTLTLSEPSGLTCSDFYLFGTITGVDLKSFLVRGSHVITWNATTYNTPEMYDLNAKGIRIFRFLDSEIQTITNLWDTLLLFEPMITKSVSSSAAARNIFFMENYAGFNMTARSIQEVSINESLVQSGDFFGVVRLDGLDPMLAWAMGSTTGHTTVAIRLDDVLYVAESTTKDSYWPTNGVQMTPFATWLEQAKAADYNVVWAPLTDEMRAKFNATAAYEFFKTVEGLDYGYHTLLWGWIDTLQDNYPCLPPDFGTCLTWYHVEVLFGLMNKMVPSVAELLFNQAFNFRLNTTGLTAPDLFMTADSMGYGNGILPTLVEQDTWMYDTTRYQNESTTGPSQVCCVFVCNMWKYGGLFDDIELQCGEQTNWDDYSLNLFDPNAKADRPEVCVAADPDNELCQLEGQYTLNLNAFNYRKPYDHMGEKCGAIPPDYKRTDGC